MRPTTVILVRSKLLSLSTLESDPLHRLDPSDIKSNFRIRLLFGCHGLESDASRFSMQKNGQTRGFPSCKLCGAVLEDATHSSCTMLEAKRKELLSSAPLQL